MSILAVATEGEAEVAESEAEVTNENGTEVIEDETETTEIPSIGDPDNVGRYYYPCKNLLLAFAANPAYAEHSEDRADAFINMGFLKSINDYFRGLSVNELHYLALHALNVLGDPPDASGEYKEHKQALLDIYNSRIFTYKYRGVNEISGYYNENVLSLDNTLSTIEQKYLSNVKDIFYTAVYFAAYWSEAF